MNWKIDGNIELRLRIWVKWFILGYCGFLNTLFVSANCSPFVPVLYTGTGIRWWATWNLISSLMQSTYNGFIWFTCYEIAFRRNFTCRGRALKMPLAIQKVLSNRVCVWEWTQLLPYLFCCPACSLIRLSCRRLTQSAINVNSKYGHQEPSSSLSLLLSLCHFVLPSVCDLSCLSAYQNADSCIWFFGCAVCAIFVLDCALNWVSYAAFTLDIWYTL